MIRYAGVDLCLDNEEGEITRFLNEHFSFEDMALFGSSSTYKSSFMGVTRGYNARGGLPMPNYSPEPKIKLNTLYWPTGAARFSRGLFMATATMKDQIYEQAQPRGVQSAPMQLVMCDAKFDSNTQIAENGFTADPDGLVALSTEMYLLPPIPVALPTDATETLWLLPLVDYRYYWQTIPVDFLDIDDPEDPPTWPELVSDVNDAIFTDYTFEGSLTISTESVYLDPDPDSFRRHHQNAGVLIDAICHSTGGRFVRKLDGICVSQSASDATTGFTDNTGDYSNLLTVAGGDFSSQHTPAMYPESVVVTFGKPLSGEVNTKEVYSTELSHDSYTPFYKKVIHCTSVDRYEDDELSENNAALADAIAGDFYAWLAKRYRYTFANIAAWTPTGFDDYIEWSFADNKITTFVCSQPYDFGVEEQLSQDGVVIKPPILVKRSGEDDVTEGETAEFDVYNPITEAVTGDTVDVKLRLGEYIDGEWGYAELVNGTQWEMINTTCG